MPTIRHRAVAAMAAATLTGVSLAALASSAGAAVTTTTVTAKTQPTIAAGINGQSAGDWSIVQSGGSVNAGDTIILGVAPNGAGNCGASGKNLGFAATPTIVVTPTVAGGTVPTWTPTLSSTGTASTGCQAAGVKDVLTLTASGAGTAASTITVSGVTYNVGVAVPGGAVLVTPGGTAGGVACAATGSGCSNALVSSVLVTTNKPPVALVPNTNAQTISNFVVTEGQAGAIPTGNFVCFSITTGQTFTPATASAPGPTVTATGGGATVTTPATLSGGSLAFQVTKQSSTAPATYTVSGIQVNTLGEGPIVLGFVGTDPVASQACGTATPPLTGTRLAVNAIAGAVITQVPFSGQDRFDTARLLGDKKFPCTGAATDPRFALLARGDNFADALAGSYLAGKHKAPMLLTNTDSLPGPTVTALRDMGINQVIVLGQQGAVSDNVVSQLKAIQSVACDGTGVTNAGNPVAIGVRRIGGGDRFATAHDIAEDPGLGAAGLLAPNGMIGTPVPTAILALGTNFPDALSAGPMAYKGTNAANGGPATGQTTGGFPLLLTNGDALSPAAQAGLNDLGIKQVIIPGGTAAVSAAVATTLTGEGINVIRLAGADRTDTAVQIATFEVGAPTATVPGLGYVKNFIQLARGDSPSGFADALAGGPYAGASVAPILLASDPSNIGSFTSGYLHANNSIQVPGGISKIAFFGGGAALTQAVRDAALAALAS